MASVLDPQEPLTPTTLAAVPEKPRPAHAYYGHFHPLGDRFMGCRGENIRVSLLPKPVPSPWDTYVVILVGLQRSTYAILMFQAGTLTAISN